MWVYLRLRRRKDSKWWNDMSSLRWIFLRVSYLYRSILRCICEASVVCWSFTGHLGLMKHFKKMKWTLEFWFGRSVYISMYPSWLITSSSAGITIMGRLWTATDRRAIRLCWVHRPPVVWILLGARAVRCFVWECLQNIPVLMKKHKYWTYIKISFY